MLPTINECRTGIDRIDAQHIALFAILVQLNAFRRSNTATSDILERSFQNLRLYAIHHFGYEEQVFIQHGIDVSDNRLAHYEFLTNIIKLESEASAHPEQSQEISGKVVEELTLWVRNHICKIDCRLIGTRPI